MKSETKLISICEIEMGQSPLGETCNLNGNGIPLLNGPTEFGEAYPLPVQFTTNPKRNSKVGDLLFCVRGSTTGRMNWADQEYAIGRGLAAIRGVNGFPNIYVRAVLEVKLPELLTQATGSTFPNVSKNMIEEIVIPKLTPYAAQEIAAILKPIENRITLLRETNITLEAIAQALFKSWFIDFDPVHAKMQGQIPEGMDEATAALFPDSFEESELGPIPNGWEFTSLDEVANFLNGLALQKFPPTGKNDLPVIKIAQLRKGDLTGADLASNLIKPEYVIQNGDVIFSWSGSLEVEIWCGGIGALNQHLFKVTSNNFEKWFYYLWTKNHLQNFRQIAASKATTMGHIQREHLTQAKVCVTSTKIFQVANTVFTPIIDLIIENSIKQKNLASIRDTLLPRLISGQIKL